MYSTLALEMWNHYMHERWTGKMTVKAIFHNPQQTDIVWFMVDIENEEDHTYQRRVRFYNLSRDSDCREFLWNMIILGVAPPENLQGFLGFAFCDIDDEDGSGIPVIAMAEAGHTEGELSELQIVKPLKDVNLFTNPDVDKWFKDL